MAADFQREDALDPHPLDVAHGVGMLAQGVGAGESMIMDVPDPQFDELLAIGNAVVGGIEGKFVGCRHVLSRSRRGFSCMIASNWSRSSGDSNSLRTAASYGKYGACEPKRSRSCGTCARIDQCFPSISRPIAPVPSRLAISKTIFVSDTRPDEFPLKAVRALSN